MKQKIIIDTDPGIDDAMAIMLAIKSNKFAIQAITTVCGNSTITNTTRNARYVINLLQSNISVYSGAKKPLKRSLIQAVVHGKSGMEGISPNNKAKLTGNAVEKILSIVKANPYKITIVALAPLTNIALAIRKNPSVMKKVKELIIMGGAIKVAGNKNRVAEFNTFVDPEAAALVFSFPVKKTIIPLDACNKVFLVESDFNEIRNTLLKKTILKMVNPYIRNIAKDEGIKSAIMYDPLTIYYLLNPKAAKTYLCNIAIETKGILTRGMTVADLRNNPQTNPNVTVVASIKKKEFKRDFIEILSTTEVI